MKKTKMPKSSKTEKKTILAFSELTGIMDRLPLRAIRIGRWFIILWPMDDDPTRASFTEAWIGGECYDDVPEVLADGLWKTGVPPRKLIDLLAQWESES